MSDWHVQKIRITEDPIIHSNADALEIFKVGEEPCIVKKDLFKVGDAALYLPIDTVLSELSEDPIVKYLGLKPGHVVCARRLRGEYSQGVLIPLSVVPGSEEFPFDEDIHKKLGVTKLIENDMLMDGMVCAGGGGGIYFGGDDIADPGAMKVYTDIDSKSLNLFNEDEDVVATLKIHGSNIRIAYKDGEIFVGSRTRIKKRNEKNEFWNAVIRLGIEEKLTSFCQKNGFNHFILYGEVYGVAKKEYLNGEKPSSVQKGFHYDTDTTTGTKVRFFDSKFSYDGPYNNWDDTLKYLSEMDLPSTLELYRGKFNKETLVALSDGPDPLNNKHTREGVVVKPLQERRAGKNLVRVVAKIIGRDYKLLKGKSHK
jgi:RNA ligase (TIGR02306 family)